MGKKKDKTEFYYFRPVKKFAFWSIGYNKSYPDFLTAELGKGFVYPRRVFCPICYNDEMKWLNYGYAKIMDKDLYARCGDGHTIRDNDLLVKANLEEIENNGDNRTARKTRNKIQKRKKMQRV